MSDIFDKLEQRRAIIDRRALADRLDAIAAETQDSGARRRAMVALLKSALDDGRAEIERRLLAHPSSGRLAASATAFLIDQIVRLSHDFTVGHLYPSGNKSSGERITLIAVGGYGRGEMAPHSDIDIGFLTPFKQTSWTESVIEAQLYTLWDLGLKVGHSSRSVDEMVRAAKDDLTIRTALLEGRFIWATANFMIRHRRASMPRLLRATRAPSSPTSSPNATSGTSAWAIRVTSSNPM